MSKKFVARKNYIASCPCCGSPVIPQSSPNMLFDKLSAARVTNGVSYGSVVIPRGKASTLTEGEASIVVVGSPLTSTLPHSIVTVPVQEVGEERKELKQEKSVGITLRIGVFFEGALSNANHRPLGLLSSATHPIKLRELGASFKYMDEPDRGYENGPSNAKKLSELYRTTDPIKKSDPWHEVFKMLYIEDLNTRSGNKNNGGSDETEVLDKVDEAFRLLTKSILKFSLANSNEKIANLTLDIFGVGLGGAAARHFANEVALGSYGPLGALFKLLKRSFHETFTSEYQYDVQIGFIGLFDTVNSLSGLGKLGYVQCKKTPGLKLDLPRKLFPNVLHLAARDEMRSNFPLAGVEPDHPEITLPGAHSDIGGGYPPVSNECLLVSPMQVLEVSLTADVKDTSIYHDAQHAMAQWLAKDWPADALEIVTPTTEVLPTTSRKRICAALQIKRQVRGELSQVYLRVMYELAKQKGVPLVPYKELHSDYVIPTELQAMCNRFIVGDFSTTPDEERLLKQRYIHVSAHWNPPRPLHDSTSHTRVRLFYFNAPTEDRRRVQFSRPPARNDEHTDLMV